MSTITLTNRATGETISDTYFNDIHSALNGDFVGRNSSGVATSGQNLGTAGVPWGTARITSLILSGSAVDTSTVAVPSNRVVSGKTRSTSNQPAFIVPNGAAASFIIDGTPTNLVLNIDSAVVTVSTDITKTGLTTAPAANNTCLIDDTAAADQDDTKYWGEYGHRKDITVDTMGSEISALIGKWASFKVAGASDEYFMAFVESATKLSKAMRGFFYNSSLAPINRAGYTNNDVVTLMSTAWIFIENNGTTVDVSYNNPTWDFTSPSSPTTGDYWYDMSLNTWKRYDGAAFQVINRTFVGIAIIDTANCVAARCVEFDARYKPDNLVFMDVATTSIVRAERKGAKVNVAGNEINFVHSLPTWNITTDLAGSADMYNATEQASTMYYLYVKDTGDTVISDIRPYWRPDLYGWYHPHNPWRQVGSAWNDGSSNIINASSRSECRSEVILTTGNGHGSSATAIRRYTTIERNIGTDAIYADSATNGMSWTIYEPGVYALNAYDNSSAGTYELGFSRNAASLTASIASFGGVTQIGHVTQTINNYGNLSSVINLLYGDVVRVHTDGSLNSTGSRASLTKIRGKEI